MAQTPWQADEARFERLALALFRFQFDACEPYARFCRSFDRTPENVTRSDEIPAVPTGAFKEFDLCCFDPREAVKTFRTSGTSSERRGQLHLDTLRLYEASLLSSLRESFVLELRGARPTMRFLAPSGEEAPDSSLTHMFETLRRADGGARSGFDLHQGRLDLASFEAAVVADREEGNPIIVAGTAFAFVHFLDATHAHAPGRWRLPAGSRLVETGGFKGRSRAVARSDLHADLASRFGIPETHILNQYGMTELGSQFYDSTLRSPGEARRKLAPPWTRVRIVDPDSGREVAPGEPGLVVILDLANTGSVAAIQTADLGRVVRDDAGTPIGFEVLGRAEGAEERGCSIATDLMLEAAQGNPTR
jgi:hypothetical protein